MPQTILLLGELPIGIWLPVYEGRY